MNQNSPQAPALKPVIRLEDYQFPPFSISETRLYFTLPDEAPLGKVRVRATLSLKRLRADEDLVLHGEALELLSVSLDGRVLHARDYRADEGELRLPSWLFKEGEAFTLETEVLIEPSKNTALSGLYQSGEILCTQCESEGFRRITYYLDRPDVMALFEVSIEAPMRLPQLLSNGNLIRAERVSTTRHLAVWADPFPKPSYLFALVAGDLFELKDEFVTRSGVPVSLHLFLEPKHKDEGVFAMHSLKRAMRFDETRFGREYDLKRFNIVAVDSFNFGAMENKSLNIFNSAYVLAHPRKVSEDELTMIDSVIAHEYFHNWTGNRITCRDWFQLSLKEGLTIFRDQTYTEETTSKDNARLSNILTLKSAQFTQDDSPMAHPPRPNTFREIRNFYTATVYEKGGEIYRMMQLVLGKERFLQGLSRYFERFDGQAATVENFIEAMQEGAADPMKGFLEWFTQAGTPRVEVKEAYDAETSTLSITFTPLAPERFPGNRPVLIPVSYALLTPDGKGGYEVLAQPLITLLDEPVVVRHEVSAKPVLSLLRGLSAPVRLEREFSQEELLALLRFDTDGYVRYEALREASRRALLTGQSSLSALLETFGGSLSSVLSALEGGDTSKDLELESLLLLPPDLNALGEGERGLDILALYARREAFLNNYAARYRSEFERVVALSTRLSPRETDDQIIAHGVSQSLKGFRKLRRLAYSMLTRAYALSEKALLSLQLSADNMGDELHFLNLGLSLSADYEGVEPFLNRYRDSAPLLRHWFSAQSRSKWANLKRISALSTHPAFSLNIPNLVSAVYGGFARNVPVFHAQDGSGYTFLCDFIKTLDARNPDVASRLLSVAFSDLSRLCLERFLLAQGALKALFQGGGLSSASYEMLERLCAEPSPEAS